MGGNDSDHCWDCFAGDGMTLTWTRERPTKAGWYWRRTAQENEIICWVAPDALAMKEVLDSLPPGEWAGPLEPPT